MKKLMTSVFALAMMTTGAMAGEVLTTSQLDQVKAGFFDDQFNINKTVQIAVAKAKATSVCIVCGGGSTAAAQAVASNANQTGQANVD